MRRALLLPHYSEAVTEAGQLRSLAEAMLFHNASSVYGGRSRTLGSISLPPKHAQPPECRAPDPRARLPRAWYMRTLPSYSLSDWGRKEDSKKGRPLGSGLLVSLLLHPTVKHTFPRVPFPALTSFLIPGNIVTFQKT